MGRIMDWVSQQDLRRLAETEQAHCLSLYMPTHRSGRDNAQDPIRLKNLLDQGEERLTAAGLRSAEARSRLAPARELFEDAVFWQNQGDGLAMFFTSGGMRYWRTAISFPELVVAGRHFHLVPLIPVALEDARFYALALSVRGVRLLDATHYTVREVHLPGVPRDFDELSKVLEDQRQLDFPASVGLSQAAARRVAAFVGHGGDNIDEAERKERLLDYCRLVDRAVREALATSRDPLILACDVNLAGVYQGANGYANLSDQVILGNPEARKDDDLRDEAWKIVRGQIEQSRSRTPGQYELARAKQRASSGLEQILAAAHDGRVDTLLLERNAQRWGRFDTTTRQAHIRETPQSGDQDLLNLAAVWTFANGGKADLYARDEMPVSGPIAAIFRF